MPEGKNHIEESCFLITPIVVHGRCAEGRSGETALKKEACASKRSIQGQAPRFGLGGRNRKAIKNTRDYEKLGLAILKGEFRRGINSWLG